jgi:hypothetical protein
VQIRISRGVFLGHHPKKISVWEHDATEHFVCGVFKLIEMHHSLIESEALSTRAHFAQFEHSQKARKSCRLVRPFEKHRECPLVRATITFRHTAKIVIIFCSHNWNRTLLDTQRRFSSNQNRLCGKQCEHLEFRVRCAANNNLFWLCAQQFLLAQQVVFSAQHVKHVHSSLSTGVEFPNILLALLMFG